MLVAAVQWREPVICIICITCIICIACIMCIAYITCIICITYMYYMYCMYALFVIAVGSQSRVWLSAHELPGSSVCGISQARILEWVSISFRKGSSRPRDWTHFSCTGRQPLCYWATRKAPCVHTSPRFWISFQFRSPMQWHSNWCTASCSCR